MKEIFPRYTIGHFINEPNNSTQFEIMRFETMEEPEVDEIHKHGFYEILWTVKGKSRQTIDYNEYEVTPASLFFISPNQVHTFENWQGLQGGTILFTEDFFLLNQHNKDKLFEVLFLDNVYAQPNIRLSKKEFSEIMYTIDLMQAEHKRGDKSQAIIQSLLHILLAQVQRCASLRHTTQSSKKYLIAFKNFKLLLDRHYVDNRNVSFYADLLHMTQHHLNLICRKVAGRTAGEVIRARGILEAKRLLTFTDLSISEIAASLNYLDASYFAKAFKSGEGKAPLEFRKEMSEKYRRY